MPFAGKDSNMSSTTSSPLFLGITAFLGGIGCATYLMRLRDRERLRNACSRVQKHLVPSQVSALGPVHLPGSKGKYTVLVIGAGSYGKLQPGG